MPPSCLFIIDVQSGFINRWTSDIPARVEALQNRFDHLVATRFYNPEGSFYRRLIGWDRFAPGSDDIALAFTPRVDARIVDKAQYSCLTAEVAEFLTSSGIERAHLCGIATDNCVLKTAVDLFERGIEPVVMADYCASHGGPECHQAGLLLLARFIGGDQIVHGL
ncbi:MAG: cysteine hydrolase [Alphaproteobacteria bacterium]|nr:cysteine hydrolase [Alphaproteobacteria bacterium]